MASEYWKTQLAGLEPTSFPDLTGTSPSLRKTLTGCHTAELSLQLAQGNANTINCFSTCLAACVKLLTLLTAEPECCIDCLFPQQQFLSKDGEDTALPLRVAFDDSSSNRDVVSTIEQNLKNARKHGPPSREVLPQMTESTDLHISNILTIFQGKTDCDPSLLSTLSAKHDVIFEFVLGGAGDTKSSSTVKMHSRSSYLHPDDTPHILSMLQQAFHSIQTDSSSQFVSWNCGFSLPRSVSNANFKSADLDGQHTIHAAFEKHAAQRPDDIALDFLEEDQSHTQWTFSTLNTLSNTIAYTLVNDYGVEIEDSVPICVSKSPAFYACVLGVLKAGGSFTPFANSPAERQRFMLDELDSKVLLHTHGQDISWASESRTLDVTSLMQHVANASSTSYSNLNLPVCGSNLCYQMYTSGSTGRPKAVSLEHRNALQTACATRDLIPWKPASRILQQAGVTFDMCYFETFFAWTVGICLSSAPDSLIYNKLTDVINIMGTSLLGLTPSVALTLDPDKVPGVEWIYCIGEALPQSLVSSWEGRLVNSYGPTEAAQMVTLFPVNLQVKSAVIGTPFCNTSFTILRKNSTEVVPILGIGELCIGGFQVAREYYKNPAKTKESFISLDGQKLYRTGDMVRMLGNGTFEFVGRVDDQVKIRGQRVELGEIDKAFEQSDSRIKRACTQILKVNDKSKSQLVAFLVFHEQIKDCQQQEIRETISVSLSRVLPAYMIPKLFLFVNEIPLSPAGKVNKRALTQVLRHSDQIKVAASHAEVKLSEDTSRMLQQIYGKVCGLQPEQINPDLSIYQLGIDSINAIQIAHKLTERGFSVQASDVMNNPTITRLSSVLKNKSEHGGDHQQEQQSEFDYEAFDHLHRTRISEQCDLSGTKIAFIRPASPLQASMIAQTIHSSGSSYFNHLTYTLPENLDAQRFLDAWDALVSKHEILRSGFTHVDDTNFPFAMITYHARSLTLPVDLSSNGKSDLDQWRIRLSETFTEQLHIPPWQALVCAEDRVFHFSAHHAVYDAQVLDILVRDLAISYDGMRLSPALPFESHLNKLLLETNSERDTRREFWQHYGNKAAACKFPLLHPLVEESSETKVSSGLSSESLSALEGGCRDAGISMQAAAQVAWGYLLGAVVGENNVTFGTVLSGRTLINSAEVSFPTITTVPTIVDVSKDYWDSVQEVMRFNADVQKHQFTRLKKIQNLMGFTEKSMFDTIFTFQKRSYTHQPTTTTFEFLSNELVIEYPVSVELEPTKCGHLQFSLYYQSKYMQHEQADLMVKQFHFLFQNIVFGKREAISPSVENVNTVLFSINPAKHEYLPSEKSLLHHAVEITARDHPDKAALEFVTSLDESGPQYNAWTFRELDEEGNRVAHFLHKIGVTPGSIVAICFEKCLEAAFTMLGISKAGCAFLALDPGAPIERKKFIIEDSQAAVLLIKGSQSEVMSSLPPGRVVDIEMDGWSKHSSHPLQLDKLIDPQQTAYCLYTSGTTGTPKGCAVTHENVTQVFCCFEKLYAHDDHSRWLQFASYHFDVSVMEHFWSWFVGMTVVKAGRDLILQDLANAISLLNITHIDLTPSLARLLEPKDVPSLAGGVFVTGGEMLRRDIIKAWGDTGAIHNAYGPTEATIGVTMYRHVPQNGRPSNIGQPFHVVGVIVVDPKDPNKPVLRGGIGELLVSGKLVAKGYLHREKLTGERFIEVGGKRCYRTGDLVRLLSDGSIDFLGRADDQVKLRGQRLEIGEINTVLRQQSTSVDDVCTLVLKHPKQQKDQLVSFVAIHGIGDKAVSLTVCEASDATTFIPKLRTICMEKLPGYMVPTHILVINKMPLSANNKIERKQLKALYEDLDSAVLQSLSDDRDTTTSSEANKEDMDKICGVLSQSLGIDSETVAPSASFFELGLDSISIINFSRSLKAAGYASASPSRIMKNPTLVRLAGAMNVADAKESDNSIQPVLQRISAHQHRYQNLALSILSVKRDEIEIVLPCTPLQAGIISRSLESEQGLYFAAFSFDLKHDVDLQRLKEACQRVYDCVQILRARFIPTDDGYIQVVLREGELPWTFQEASNKDQLDDMLHKAHNSWWRRNQPEILHPFEILVIRTDEGTILTLHIFHALYDGNSLPLLTEKVVKEYKGVSGISYQPNFSDVLPYGPLHEVTQAEPFWLDHLSPMENTTLADIKPLSSTIQGRVDSCVTHRIEPLDGLEGCRRKLNVTHQAIIQACWTVLLQDVMSGPLVLGIIVSGRSIDYDGAENVIGPLFNTVPFLLTLAKEDTWKSIITTCHNFNTAVLSYQHTPLRDIQKWTRRYRANKALFDSLFVFQKKQSTQSTSESLWTLREETFETDYPLAFEAEQTEDGGFNLTLACQANVSDEKASTTTLLRFERLLRHIIENLDEQCSKSTMNDLTIRHRQRNKPSERETNGNGVRYELHSNGNGTSAMSEVAETVRKEIALLADVSSANIHKNTSIFEVGLDSIDAVKLASRLKKDTGAGLPVSRIMKLLTVQQIASAIEDQDSATVKETTVYDLEKDSKAIELSLGYSRARFSKIESIRPCTPLQEGMIADMLESGFERYLNFDVLKISKKTDVEALKAAWLKVIDTFPILRSQFVEVVDPQLDCTFAQIAMHPPTMDFGYVEANINADFSAVFSQVREQTKATYSDGPALRLTFVGSSEASRPEYLVLSLPHAMYDGWSLGLIHQSVLKAYYGQSIHLPSYEPALANIMSCITSSSLDFWRQSLSDTKSTLFPQKYTGGEGIHRTQLLSRMGLNDIVAFCKRYRVTISALCQTIWSIVLAHYTQQLDVSFAQVLSGRTDEAANQVVFPTMNTVISRTIIHGMRPELVQYVQDNLTTISEHQHLPLRKGQALTSHIAPKDIFNTLFIFQKTVQQATSEDRQLYQSIEGASNVEYPVCVEAEADDHGLVWRTACEASHLNASETETLLENLDQVLQSIIGEPEKSAVEFSDAKMALCGLPFIGITKQEDTRTSSTATEAKNNAGREDWSPKEQTIRKIIADVGKLTADEVDKHSSLLGLGLDSISTIKVSSLLRKQGFKIGVKDLLSAGTVAKIASLCDTTDLQHSQNGFTNGSAVKTPNQKEPLFNLHVDELLKANNLTAEDVEQVLPVSAGQMLLLSRWQNEGIYYSSLDFFISGCSDMNRVRSTWSKLVAQSPMLRTIFIATGDRSSPIVQATLKTNKSQFVEVFPGDELEVQARRNVGDEPEMPKCPCALYAQQTGSDRIDLALKLSHALYDGFSLKMLIATLQNLLNDRSASPVRGGYTFSNYLAATSSSPAKRKFWTRYLANVKIAQLPLPQERPSSKPVEQVHVVRTNVLQNLSTVKSYARKYQVSIQSLLLASYAVTHALALSKTCTADNDVPDVLVGIFMANRNLDGADELDAPTLGFAPVRVRHPLTRSLVDVALGIQNDMREISEDGRSQVGLWELQEWLGDHIKVDVWVNILRQWLPDQSEDNADSIQVITGEKSEDLEKVYDVTRTDEDIQHGLLLKNNVVRSCYDYPMMDLEATIKDDNLDIGIQAPTALLSVAKAKEIIQDVTLRLNGWVEEDKDTNGHVNGHANGDANGHANGHMNGDVK